MNKIEEIISQTIRGSEFENRTYLVGGYVRDQIMGTESDDIDIVVEMDKGGKKLAELLHCKGVSSRPVIFDRFGTAQVMINNFKIELVMTRKETYNFKDRKPEVRHATLREDTFRRDFTINSLLKNISTSEILDITKLGKQDIKNKLIRSTSEPKIIFEEDPLRMLRAIRFYVQLDFEIEANTLSGILDCADKLMNISHERIRDELKKILISENAVKGIKMLISSGLMKYIIPELLELEGLAQNKYHDKDALGHTLQVVQFTPKNLELRLAALLHDIAKPLVKSIDKKGIHFYKHEIEGEQLTRKILNRLKFPKVVSRKVCFLVRNHMRFKQFGEDLINFKDKTIRKYMLEMGDNLEDLLQIIHADNISHAEKYRLNQQVPNLIKRIENIKKNQKEFRLPINGSDIILHFGINEGKRIGILLKKAEEIWLENPQWGKNKILNFLKSRRKS